MRRILVFALVAMLAGAGVARADISLQSENPLAGSQWHHDFEGLGMLPNRLAFAITLGAGTGQEIAVSVEAYLDTEVLIACDNRPSCTDHSVDVWTDIRPDLDPESGTVALSFQPAVSNFALRIDTCEFGTGPQMVGATAHGGGGDEVLALSPCVVGQWLVVRGVGAGHAPIDSVRLRGNAGTSIHFDDLYVDFGGTPPPESPDLATTARTTSGHSNTPGMLGVEVKNLEARASPDATLVLLLPPDLLGRTSPADDGGRIDLALGPLAGVSATTSELQVTPPVMDCHTRLTTIAVARTSGTEPNTANNIAAQVLIQDPGDRLPREDCSGNSLDGDCDNTYGCVDQDCRTTEACRHFYEPIVVWDGNPIWDLWPPILPPFPTDQPGGPPMPYEFPDPYDLPPPPAQCFVMAHGMPQARPLWCCDPPPAANSEHAQDYAFVCPPHDPNFIEAAPPVSAHGVGWVTAGQNIAFTIHYENDGASDAHDVAIVEVLPPELDEATLALADGGNYDPATRVLTWIDPVVFPDDPRAVHFSASIRADAPIGTKTRNMATIVFPDAFPPSRTDTNTIVHVIPDPEVKLEPALFVSHCVAIDRPGVYRVKIQNRGLANAYNVTATIIDPPAGIIVADGSATFAAPSDPSPERLATVAILSTTDSTDTVDIHGGAAGVDPCLTLTWQIDYETFKDGKKQVKVATVADVPSGCSCSVGSHDIGGALVPLVLCLAVVRRRRRRGMSASAASSPRRRRTSA